MKIGSEVALSPELPAWMRAGLLHLRQDGRRTETLARPAETGQHDPRLIVARAMALSRERLAPFTSRQPYYGRAANAKPPRR